MILMSHALRADNSLYGGWLGFNSFAQPYGYGFSRVPFFGWKGNFGQLNVVGSIALATSNTTCASLCD